MSKFGVLVTGPAGAGKTTFCSSLIEHLQNVRRSCFYVNLDPAAEEFKYEPDLDIRELISLQDVMEDMSLGPNGGLMYCFDFLLQNLDFLTDGLEALSDDYLIIFDMPGQIELYTHVPLLPSLIQHLSRAGPLNISLCAAYLLEATFIEDRSKFFAGALSAMSAMIMLEMPHVNILSKVDQIQDHVPRKELKRFTGVDVNLLEEVIPEIEEQTIIRDPSSKDAVMSGRSFQHLNRSVAQLIDDFSMVSFLKLEAFNPDSIQAVLSYIDDAIQFSEAQEPKEPAESRIEDEE